MVMNQEASMCCLQGPEMHRERSSLLISPSGSCQFIFFNILCNILVI